MVYSGPVVAAGPVPAVLVAAALQMAAPAYVFSYAHQAPLES